MVTGNTKIIEMRAIAEELYDKFSDDINNIPSETPQKTMWRKTKHQIEERYETISQRIKD